MVQVITFGWQDKSGDVWIDLATNLLNQGCVRVANAEFSDRKEYLQFETEAKTARIGIWEK
jgi:endonuclease YncB( thermonuclease family)